MFWYDLEGIWSSYGSNGGTWGGNDQGVWGWEKIDNDVDAVQQD